MDRKWKNSIDRVHEKRQGSNHETDKMRPLMTETRKFTVSFLELERMVSLKEKQKGDGNKKKTSVPTFLKVYSFSVNDRTDF